MIRQRPRNTNPQVIKVLRLVAKTKGTVPCVSTEAAQRCYTEITAIAGADDCLGLLQSYHGRALCAQHINDSDGALRWSEQAALVALERRDMNYYASALITWGSCLAKMGKNDAALAMLATIDSNSRFPARVAHQARSALLLCFAEQDPYPEEICISLEQYLSSVLFVNPPERANSSGDPPQCKTNDHSFEHVTTRWALAKSQLRRADRDSILPVIRQFSGLFLDLAHQGWTTEVLAHGASLRERLHDWHTAYILLKEAYKLNSGIAVEGRTKQNFRLTMWRARAQNDLGRQKYPYPLSRVPAVAQHALSWQNGRQKHLSPLTRAARRSLYPCAPLTLARYRDAQS